MSAKWGPEVWVTVPGLERAELENGKHRVEGTDAPAPAEHHTTSRVHGTRDKRCRTNGKMTSRLENKTASKLVIQVVSLKGSAQIPKLLKMKRRCRLCGLTCCPARKALADSCTQWAVGGTVWWGFGL